MSTAKAHMIIADAITGCARIRDGISETGRQSMMPQDFKSGAQACIAFLSELEARYRGEAIAEAAEEAHDHHVESVAGTDPSSTYPQPQHGWTCFHCGETFTTPGAARDHFGATPHAEPGCLIRVQVGEERGLLMALRKAEEQLDRYLARDSDLAAGLPASPLPPSDDHPQAPLTPIPPYLLQWSPINDPLGLASEPSYRPALEEIRQEADRQVKGYTHAHDDETNRDGELSQAAAWYAMGASFRRLPDTNGVGLCPWSMEFKFYDRRSKLIVSAALLLREIERLDRAERRSDAAVVVRDA